MASIPQCHVLFVGPVACTRHDILTVMMKIKNKMSHLCVSEADIITGHYYNAIDNAVKELINEAGARAVIIITCCQNELIGTDYEMLCKSIRRKFGISAECVQINRLNMFRASKGAKLTSGCLEDVLCGLLVKDATRANGRDKAVNVLGGIYPLPQQNELIELLAHSGYKIRHLSTCTTYDEFLKMAHSALNIVADSNAIPAAKRMEYTFGIPWVDMSFTLSLDEIIGQYRCLENALGIPLDVSATKCRLENKISNSCHLLNGTPISIDGRVIAYPYSVAKALIEYGFQIEGIVTTEFTAKELESKAWIEANAPNISVEFISLRRQRPTIGNRFFSHFKIRVPKSNYPIGFSYIHQVFDTLAEEYRKKEGLV